MGSAVPTRGVDGGRMLADARALSFPRRAGSEGDPRARRVGQHDDGIGERERLSQPVEPVRRPPVRQHRPPWRLRDGCGVVAEASTRRVTVVLTWTEGTQAYHIELVQWVTQPQPGMAGELPDGADVAGLPGADGTTGTTGTTGRGDTAGGTTTRPKTGAATGGGPR